MTRQGHAWGLTLLALALLGCTTQSEAAAGDPPAHSPAPAAPAGERSKELPPPPPGYGEVHVIVLGVTSPFSTFGLGRRLLEVPGVTRVRFIMEEGRAVLWLAPGAEVSEAELRQAVRNASFTAGRIIWVRSPAPKPDGLHSSPHSG
jgi:hypothetical protein